MQGLEELCKGKKFTAPVHLEVDKALVVNGNGNGSGGIPEMKRPRTD